MPTAISIQPQSNRMCSTLVPILLQVTDTVASTVNIIATCYYDDSGSDVQIGGQYRCAPDLSFPDAFKFDASEIFNTKTKYVLSDMPSMTIGSLQTSIINTVKVWDDIATWKVRVKFQREFINANDLVEIDPTPYYSNYFYIHEGCPPREVLTTMVTNNGLNDWVFKYFNASYNANISGKHYLTNYPIEGEGSRMKYAVTIRPTESYMIAWFSPPSNAGYEMEVRTGGSGGFLMNTHTIPINSNHNFQTAMVGFRDVINGLTPNNAEGTDFENVTSYTVRMKVCSNNVSPCTYVTALVDYHFTIDRTCVGKGYLRFAFKNMLGGYDLVSSTGSYQKKIQNKFTDFEKSTGYIGWNGFMQFGDVNWANENVESYTVTTQPMKKEYANHFAEMFSSVDVYLREPNLAYTKVMSPDLAETQREQPYLFCPIKIKGATIEKWKTTNNNVKLKFTFSRSINQRNPRN